MRGLESKGVVRKNVPRLSQSGGSFCLDGPNTEFSGLDPILPLSAIALKLLIWMLRSKRNSHSYVVSINEQDCNGVGLVLAPSLRQAASCFRATAYCSKD